MAYIGKSPSVGVRDRYYYTAAGSEISVSGPDDNGRTLVFTDGKYVDVTLNGITLVAGVDYNTATTNTIAGLDPLTANDILEVVVYDVFAIADTVSSTRGGTYQGQVTFTGGVSGILLDSLDDVNLGTPQNGQVLTYKDSSGLFELDSAASAMAQLSDVNLTGLQDGHTIVYNAGSGEFQADSIAGGNITTNVLWENASLISTAYSITAGNNALSAGPITVDSGGSVTVPSGSRWVVV
jgi:hypothetical protein